MQQEVLKDYVSFSGSDAISQAVFPNASPITIGMLRAISYSVLRPLAAVHTLGKVRQAGFSKGARVVAGTLILAANYNEHWVHHLLETADIFARHPNLKLDELPPFDIVTTVANEYGAASHFTIYGVRLVDDGQVTSDEDVITENVITFQALDIDPMRTFRVLQAPDVATDYVSPRFQWTGNMFA